MAGRIHGKKGQIKMDPAGAPGTAATAVADINAFTIDMSTDTVDVTALGDTNKQYVQGLPDYKGTLSGWWNSATSPALFEVILGGGKPWLVLIPDTSEPTFLFKGLAYLSGSIDVSATGAVSISGDWVGAGNWVMEP